MPRRIVTQDGSRFWIADYELPPHAPDEVRVQVEFAAPKHGTEAQIIGGSVFQTKRWDSELRLFLPVEAPAEPPPPTAPPAMRGVGNMIVGTALEVGAAVTRFAPGDRVFGGGQIRELHQAPESKLRPLDTLTAVDAVCTEPGHVAFVAVRDGNIRVGDDVAVYGLGAIGLLAIQIAKAGGARRVFGVDPLPNRREYAAAHGADAVFDPRSCDAALEIKLETERQGVDVALETSGNAHALHDSIRCIRQCGAVVHVPWGPKDGSALHLGEEFHHNRPTLIGSQAWAGWGNPSRDHPLWDEPRAYQATVELFRSKRITGEGIVTPIVSFEEASDALATIFTAPERSIKIGVRFY
jgi:threonine dehydrogenase-like Zn-dependent dehydrogenase